MMKKKLIKSLAENLKDFNPFVDPDFQEEHSLSIEEYQEILEEVGLLLDVYASLNKKQRLAVLNLTHPANTEKVRTHDNRNNQRRNQERPKS